MRTRLTAGLRGGGYLLVRFLAAIGLLAVLPLTLILSLLVPPVARELVRLAYAERARAGVFLGLTGRPAGIVGAMPGMPIRNRPYLRSLGLLLLYVPASLLGGIVTVYAVFSAPGALPAMMLWPLDPGGFTLMGIGVSSWSTALLAGLAQILVGLGMLAWLVPPLARLHATMTWRLLAPSRAEREAAELAARVDELTRTRAGAVDSHGAELRRIERDLHDGTQAQLVSLAMRIGVAKQMMGTDPQAAAKLLDDARDGAEQAMTELRGVLRTMYPPILADRGLAGAVSALGARCPVPALLRIGPLGEVPAAVEAAAYFVVAEALTNAAKHSGAGHVDVHLERRGADLYLAVTDDGIGGADLGRGTGLAGVVHRVEALDGRVRIDSPVGGPTAIEVVLPCE
jgi:signal transduction histidine kinase